MAKQYRTTWGAEKLTINFNQKQWRQDFAAFVKEKRYWAVTRVTKSRSISRNPLDKGIKTFTVYDRYGNEVKITYQNNNEIINTTDSEITLMYFEERKNYSK